MVRAIASNRSRQALVASRDRCRSTICWPGAAGLSRLSADGFRKRVVKATGQGLMDRRLMAVFEIRRFGGTTLADPAGGEMRVMETKRGGSGLG